MHKHKKYLFSADLIRAVAIVCVVIIHVFSEYVNNSHIFLTTQWWTINFIDSLARSSVPLFVMLSGMLILHNEKTYTALEFIKKRVGKIGVPLLIWPIFYALWNIWINHKIYTFNNLLHDFLSLSIYYHLYYLYVMAGLYLLSPILKIFINNATKANKQYFITLAFLFSLAIIGLKYFFHMGMNVGTIFTIAIPFIPYYLAGDYLRNLRLTKKRALLFTAGFIFLAILTAVGLGWYMQRIGWSQRVDLTKANYDRYFYDYLSITVVGMSLLAFPILNTLGEKSTFLQKGITKKVIIQLANTSLGIYLIHPVFLDISNKILKINYAILPLPTWCLLLVKTFVILAISYALVIVVKRISLLRMLV